MASEGWTTIESDPGLFTSLMERIGVRGVQMEELYEIDAAHLKASGPVYGFIFLFKWNPSLQRVKTGEETPGIYFAKQLVNNACATQAILSVLMNQDDASLDIGDTLRELRGEQRAQSSCCTWVRACKANNTASWRRSVLQEFTTEFDGELKGETISNAHNIRLVHNSFAAPEGHLTDSGVKKATEDDDVFHFVAYIYKHGSIWELDGLQQGPIKHVQCEQAEWLTKMAEVIGERMALYSQKETRFNLMAIVRDPREQLKSQLMELEAAVSAGTADQEAASHMESIRQQLAVHEAQREQWDKENKRRQHNYIPLVYNLLTLFARHGKLEGLLRDGKTRVGERLQRHGQGVGQI